MPATITMESATRLCLAKLRPGTPNTVSSAENSDAKMRRAVQASSSRPGQWNRWACSTNVRRASIEAGERWMTTPRTSSMLPW